MKTFPLPEFDSRTRSRAREALRLAGAWFTNCQTTHAWPCWTADAGRFLGHVTMTRAAEKEHKTICWATARAAQAVLSIHRVLGGEALLQTAVSAMEYVKSCQIFAPEFFRHAGACAEETPQADHIASRDTVEALQGFVNLYAVTGDPVMLRRAEAAADWFCGWFLEKGFPNGYIWHKNGNDKGTVNNDFSRIMLGAVSLVLSQLDAITGVRKYAPFIPRVLDWVITHSLEKNGALRIHDGTDVGHHAIQEGPNAKCFTNDDGAVIAMMAAFRATGDDKYREAALRNANWWLTVPTVERPFASLPAVLLNLLDFYRFSGNRAFLDKAADYIEKVLALQVTDSDNPRFLGGFRGHDYSSKRENDYFSGINPVDIISIRTTMYASMALSKAAAEKESEWNMAYSAFGW